MFLVNKVNQTKTFFNNVQSRRSAMVTVSFKLHTYIACSKTEKVPMFQTTKKLWKLLHDMLDVQYTYFNTCGTVEWNK